MAALILGLHPTIHLLRFHRPQCDVSSTMEKISCTAELNYHSIMQK